MMVISADSQAVVRRDGQRHDRRRRGSISKEGLATCFLVSLIFVPTVVAGWLSLVGIVALVVAVVAAVAMAPVVALVAVIVGVIAIGADLVMTTFGVNGCGPVFQPPFAVSPEPEPFLDGKMAMLMADYQPLDLPGDEMDFMVMATNEAIVLLNILTDDFLAKAPREQIMADLGDLGEKISDVANEWDGLGIDIAISQGDIDSTQAEFDMSGLPDFMVDYLGEAGLSEVDIAAFGDYSATTEINVVRGGVSGSDVLHQTATMILQGACPEDLDGDRAVGSIDLLGLLVSWGGSPPGPPDFNCDGTVGATDLLQLLVNWGQCP